MRVLVFLRTKTVRVLVERRNITMGELAEELGVSKTYLSLMLSGKAHPSPELRSRMIEAFKGHSHKPGGRVSWDDLFQTAIKGESVTSA